MSTERAGHHPYGSSLNEYPTGHDTPIPGSLHYWEYAEPVDRVTTAATESPRSLPVTTELTVSPQPSPTHAPGSPADTGVRQQLRAAKVPPKLRTTRLTPYDSSEATAASMAFAAKGQQLAAGQNVVGATHPSRRIPGVPKLEPIPMAREELTALTMQQAAEGATADRRLRPVRLQALTGESATPSGSERPTDSTAEQDSVDIAQVHRLTEQQDVKMYLNAKKERLEHVLPQKAGTAQYRGAQESVETLSRFVSGSDDISKADLYMLRSLAGTDLRSTNPDRRAAAQKVLADVRQLMQQSSDQPANVQKKSARELLAEDVASLGPHTEELEVEPEPARPNWEKKVGTYKPKFYDNITEEALEIAYGRRPGTDQHVLPSQTDPILPAAAPDYPRESMMFHAAKTAPTPVIWAGKSVADQYTTAEIPALQKFKKEQTALFRAKEEAAEKRFRDDRRRVLKLLGGAAGLLVKRSLLS